ncbi:MAG TPA: hypothetical protein VFL80_08525 [Thermoanaerobaculia bacterium]|nr:hypothetical protein [Thermoanaerobaculia bacterium]
MNSETVAAGVLDSSLQPFFRASSGSAQEEASLRTLIEQVMPVIHGVIRGKLFGATAETEREEIVSDVTLQLIKKLQEMKSDPQMHPIANFSGYAAVTAFNVIHAYIRRAHPERQRLRNRVRHVIRKSTRFASWQSLGGQVLCGPAAWKGMQDEASDAQLDSVPPIASLPSAAWNNITPAVVTKAVDHVFAHLQKPVALERMVEKMAELLRLPAPAASAVDSVAEAQEPSVESSLIYRSALKEVWQEIESLPVRQRVALLLGLRDEDGGAMVSLLILLRITTAEGLARTLEMATDELAALWDKLPLPDMAIAERLGLARQQVINLRKSARERLGRRLAFLRDGNPLLN